MALRTHQRRILSIGILGFVLLFVAADPIRIVNASLDKSATMPCCAGKGGHCELGMAAKKAPPRKAEPMCGRKDLAIEDDGITIVADNEPAAEHAHNHAQSKSSGSAFETAAAGHSCHHDCGACATSATRVQKRERTVVLTNKYAVQAVATSSKYEQQFTIFSSREDSSRINSRGPPSRR